MNIVPREAMVQGDDEGPARFVISEDLLVTMANGAGITLSIQLSPVEARQFAQILDLVSDDVEKRENHYLDFVSCAGSA